MAVAGLSSFRQQGHAPVGRRCAATV